MTNKIFLIIFVLFQASSLAFAGGRSSNAPNLMDRFLQETQVSSASQNYSSATAAEVCEVTIPGQSNALVVSKADHEAALTENFGLRKMLQAIINTSGSVTTSPEELFASMSASFQNADGSLALHHANNGVDMPVDPRISELDFVTSNLDNVIGSPTLVDPGNTIHVVEEMAPTGLFNRFDLAAADGSNCGEYRVVYHWIEGGLNHGAPFEAGSLKFFMIFEAQYPNPSPAQGLAGCLPVASFWESLNSLTDSTELIAELEEFYFTGKTHDGVFLPPVVNFNHYKHDAGQVRVNMFVHHGSLDTPTNTQVWQLREFRTALSPQGDAIFAVDTVKVNPLVELYSDTLPAFLGHLPPNFQTDFQGDFVEHVVEGLLAPELAGLSTQTDIVNNIRMTDLSAFNEFQSNSSGRGSIPADNPLSSAGIMIRDAIAIKLSSLPVPSTITPDHVLNRASANTCAGCHAQAFGNEIAPGIDWPATQPATRFVHIHERGALSNVLTEHFLVGRADVLTDFICNPPAPVCTADADGDLVCDDVDNCTNVQNPDQTDTDGDGHGNICDGDFDQSCIVSFSDLAAFRQNFFGSDPEFDLDSSGPPVNFGDLAIFKGLFFGVPGPSAAGSLCNP